MVRIEPNNDPGCHELYVGLILQYHCVGLDKLTENTDANDGENLSDTTAVNNVASEQDSQVINDAVFDEGDEHSMRITGGPQASMMTVENPEATTSVAPGEGQKPLFIMSDIHF